MSTKRREEKALGTLLLEVLSHLRLMVAFREFAISETFDYVGHVQC